MAELADAPDLGSGGKPWGFDSLYPHQHFPQGEGFPCRANLAIENGRI